MDSLIQDVLNANVVFVGVELMNRPDARDNLIKAVNAEVMNAEVGFAINASGGAPTPSHRFVIPRYRISLDITSTRSSITKEYLSQTSPSEDLEQLSNVASSAICNTIVEGQQLVAYGYNMAIVFSPDLSEPAIQHLGKRLYAPQAHTFGREDWDFTGGLGTLYFSDGNRRWTFNMEPRPREDFGSKRLYISINLHVDEQELPDENAIKCSFEEVLNEANRLMKQLLAESN
ncbi:MAG: hypothetical protein F4Y44_02900 [Chloroflexi bacterium]|nr:hypothetical protein [Chloroflexota bacterium]